MGSEVARSTWSSRHRQNLSAKKLRSAIADRREFRLTFISARQRMEPIWSRSLLLFEMHMLVEGWGIHALTSGKRLQTIVDQR